MTTLRRARAARAVFRLLGLASLVLAVTGLAFFFMVKAILKPAPGEWATGVHAGPVTVRVGVPSLIWLATTPWVGPLLDGRRLPTRLGTAARLSKVSAKMLRHYESLGLLAPVAQPPARQCQRQAHRAETCGRAGAPHSSHAGDAAHAVVLARPLPGGRAARLPDPGRPGRHVLLEVTAVQHA